VVKFNSPVFIFMILLGILLAYSRYFLCIGYLIHHFFFTYSHTRTHPIHTSCTHISTSCTHLHSFQHTHAHVSMRDLTPPFTSPFVVVSMFVWGGKPSKSNCVAAPMLAITSVVLVYGCVIAKTIRVYRIMRGVGCVSLLLRVLCVVVDVLFFV
jgi:hypothetical protein